MPGTVLNYPLPSARPEGDPALYREIVLDPSARSGHFRRIADAVEYAAARCSAATPWVIRLLPGTHKHSGSRLVFPAGLSLIGHGLKNTILEKSDAGGVQVAYSRDRRALVRPARAPSRLRSQRHTLLVSPITP